MRHTHGFTLKKKLKKQTVLESKRILTDKTISQCMNYAIIIVHSIKYLHLGVDLGDPSQRDNSKREKTLGPCVLYLSFTRTISLYEILDPSHSLLLLYYSILILPEYYRACRLQGYDERLTSMTVPLMTTVSNCGSALFIGAASLFVTQYAGVTIDTPQMIIIL